MKTLAIKKINIKLILFIFLIFILFLPFISHGAARGITWFCGGTYESECTFQDLLDEVNNLVKWGTAFALSFSVIVLAWAGFIYMTSGGNPGERSKANTMLTKVVIGIILIVLAYLIVQLIVKGLQVNPGIVVF